MSEHPPPREAHWTDGAIFTLGHSTLPIASFVALLHAYGIERLVDIRSIRSRHNPHQRHRPAESLKRSISNISISGAGRSALPKRFSAPAGE
jgi:hypothetical protein